jgi:endonuclease-3
VGGSYVLLVELETPAEVAFGAVGTRSLGAGLHAYVGSARGAGGFARLERHREVARGTRSVRHWHVDHLLGHDAASVAGDRRFGEPVVGVGCTDCGCRSHLFRIEPGGLEDVTLEGRGGS